MSVNDDKTQILCITAAKNSSVTSYIRTANGSEVKGGDRLKQLGFNFGTYPNASVQVEHMRKKFRGRLWMIRHLQKAGLTPAELLRVYRVFLLSVLDFASVVYHPILTAEQSAQLEALQRSAMKLIFGRTRSYDEILAEESVERLRDRRERMTDKFILKAAKNHRIKDTWFPKRGIIGHDLRRDVFYHEAFARTSRLYNSPIFYYRRRLNEISTPETLPGEEIQML